MIHVGVDCKTKKSTVVVMTAAEETEWKNRQRLVVDLSTDRLKVLEERIKTLEEKTKDMAAPAAADPKTPK